MSKKKKVALVIGSGSVKCSAALGVHKALEAAGIELDMVVGCSGGSIYASLIALGFSAERAITTTMNLWTAEVTAQRNRQVFLQILFPKLFGFDGKFGLVKDHLIMERLKAAYGELSFEDTQIPLHIVATDLENGEQVTITENLIRDAIRASISIPYIFEPYPIDGRLMIDGAMVNPLPVDIAMKEGADIIIALGFEGDMQYRISSILRYSFQISTIMSNNLLHSNLAFQQFTHHEEIITILPLFEERIKAFDTGKIPMLIEAGEQAMQEEIAYVKQLLGVADGE